MRDGKPSMTARWVAVWRGLASFFPAEMRLIDDPYGLVFGAPYGKGMAAFSRVMPLAARALFRRGRLFAFAGWLQLRTRIIDDTLREFVRAGGRQVVILGAGYDARALRLSGLLGDAMVFEVDHPATQARKLKILKTIPADLSRVRFLAWDFEARPVTELPAALAGLGHDPARPTLVIWEGVTQYLSERAITQTVAAVHALSAPGSRLVINYSDRARIEKRRAGIRAMRWVGEPPRFGWDPAALPQWMQERGFNVLANLPDHELAARYFPPALAASYPRRGSNVALCAPRD
jgi:methyltransferase (TIGR00027 family)